MVSRDPSPADGDDGGPGPASWPAARRRALRAFRLSQTAPFFVNPDGSRAPFVQCDCHRGLRADGTPCMFCGGVGERPPRMQLDGRCPHGTEGGYTNWRCECWQTWDGRPGCGPVGRAKSRSRTSERRDRARRDRPTPPPPDQRQVTPPRPAPISYAITRREITHTDHWNAVRPKQPTQLRKGDERPGRHRKTP